MPSLKEIRRHLLVSVSSFRIGMQAQGNAALVCLVDGLQQALETPSMGLDAGVFLPHLREILQAQQRGDYLRVADLLEFELSRLI